MSDAKIDIHFDGLDDLPRALRTSVAVGGGAVVRLKNPQIALQLARRIEDAAPRYLVVERDKPSSFGSAIFASIAYSCVLNIWIFDFIPDIARSLRGLW